MDRKKVDYFEVSLNPEEATTIGIIVVEHGSLTYLILEYRILKTIEAGFSVYILIDQSKKTITCYFVEGGCTAWAHVHNTFSTVDQMLERLQLRWAEYVERDYEIMRRYDLKPWKDAVQFLRRCRDFQLSVVNANKIKEMALRLNPAPKVVPIRPSA